MNLIQFLTVSRYFKKKTNKVKCEDVFVSFPSPMSKMYGMGKFVPFQLSFMKNKLKYKKWVKQSLGVCYEHSSSLLLGLNDEDKCIIAKCDYHNDENFYHAWNEFKFNNRWYVYDCQNDFIYEKEFYYKKVVPTILKEFTQKDVVEHFKNLAQNGKGKTIINVPYKFDRNIENFCKIPNIGHINYDYLYHGAKIEIKNEKIVSSIVGGAQID